MCMKIYTYNIHNLQMYIQRGIDDVFKIFQIILTLELFLDAAARTVCISDETDCLC